MQLHDQPLQEAMKQLEIAHKNVIEAQGTTDAQHFQRAQQNIKLAEELLNKAQHSRSEDDPEINKQYTRAQDLLRLIEETQNSLR